MVRRRSRREAEMTAAEESEPNRITETIRRDEWCLDEITTISFFWPATRNGACCGHGFRWELDGEDSNMWDLFSSLLLKPASIVMVTEKAMTVTHGENIFNCLRFGWAHPCQLINLGKPNYINFSHFANFFKMKM